MTTYLWNQGDFYKELNAITDIKKINIATAYLSKYGVILLREICNRNQLKKENVNVYLSVEFNEREPVEILSLLQGFATVFLIPSPFMHCKVYEVHCIDGLFLFNGSANLSENGVSKNIEMMSKEKFIDSPLYRFWEKLNEDSLPLTNELIKLYEAIEKMPSYSSPYKKEWGNITTSILDIKNKKDSIVLLNHYIFDAEDYETLSQKWWRQSNQESIQRRKRIQEKLLLIDTSLSPILKKLDLHHHPNEQYITSGMIPSQFNHGKVGWLCLRYGKEDKELNPFRNLGIKRRRGDKDSIEQFHKHAFFQFLIGNDGVEIGLFHGTAHDGVDRYHVRENWPDVKEKIRDCYEILKGNEFIWNFYDPIRVENHKLEIDKANVDEFISFYINNDVDGLESFCIRRYQPLDSILKEQATIVTEAVKTYKILMPLYKAMTYRVPINQR